MISPGESAAAACDLKALREATAAESLAQQTVRPTRAEIEAIGRHNPIVRQSLQLHESGECTYEEAMMFAVIALASLNAELTDVRLSRPYFEPRTIQDDG